MANSKIENWNLSVEADYLSMYIKTWFTFLCTLQELHPGVQSTRGDKELLDKYIDNYTIPMSYEPTLRLHIEEVHKTGNEVIKRDLPSTYFGRFYEIDKLYNFQVNQANRISGHIETKICYKDKLGGQKEPNLFIYFKSIRVKFNTDLRKHIIEENIPLKPIIDALKQDDSSHIVNYLENEIKLKCEDYIFNSFPTNITPQGKAVRKAYVDSILREIMQNWRLNFQANQLFREAPINGFPLNYDNTRHKKEIINWFIRFNYSLRNIMFHYIINPFDKDWLKLFKHTYLALKEIVNHNIEEIKGLSP